MNNFLENLKKQFQENVWDNEQVLQLRQRFSELDAQTQSYSLIGAFAFFLFLLLGSLLYLGITNASLQSQIVDMDTSIHHLQASADKMEDLRAKIRSQSSDPSLRDLDRSAPLNTFTEKAAQKAFIGKDSFEISNEKQSSAVKGMIQNSLDVKLSRISLRQLVRMLYFIEQTQSGIDVQKLNIDSKDDPSGYLWASLSLQKTTEFKKALH
jgi:hypothetical protein